MAPATRIQIENLAPLAPVRDRIHKTVRTASGELQRAAAHLFLAGGKQFRPTLVILCAQAVRGDDGANGSPSSDPIVWDSVYDVAAAAEMIHVASLIHDDIIDESPTRRERLSVNARWDNHLAVLAGDYLFASAFSVLAAHSDKGMVTLMTDAIAAMCRGEVMQKEQAFDPDVTEEAYTARVQGKTAALLAACCEAGARLADADAPLCDEMRLFGLKLGLAYQIIDDVLDLEGNSREMGKPAGSDLRQGILTLPVIRLLRDTAWRERLAPRITRRAVDPDTIDLVRYAARSTGAIDGAKRDGKNLAAEAVHHLRRLKSHPGAACLASLCQSAVERES